jgi:pilus assembly protein TadC
MARIPLMIIPLNFCLKIKPLYGLGAILAKLSPSLERDLNQADMKVEVEGFMVAVLINALLFAVILGGLFIFLLFDQGRTVLEAIQTGLLIALGLFVLFGGVLLRYPKVNAGKKAEQIDRLLLFALKDIYLQVSSGVSLYIAFVTVANAGYGTVSKEFKKVVNDMNRGITMADALNKMAEKSKSDYLKRTLWQIINTLKAGASVKGALKTIIRELTSAQERKIKDYAKELNLWSLIYMLFAVAIPTIGATMLVILSGFAGFKITPVSFVSFIGITMFFQLALIGFIKTRRPVVQF